MRDLVIFLTQSWDPHIQYRFKELKEGSGKECVLMSDSPAVPAEYRPHIPRGFKTISGGNKVYPGCIDYYLIDYSRSHPDFDRLWLVEYDMIFTGSWKTFFDRVDGIEADLLSPFSIIPATPDWWWYTDKFRWRVLFPIRRYSRKLLEELDLFYSGLHQSPPHFETVVPSLCVEKGLTFSQFPSDLIGYISDKEPDTWDYRKNKLYHPEK